MTVDVDALFAVLRGIPRLVGALCSGRPELFDAPELETESDAGAVMAADAIAICQMCPALADCSRWVESLPPRHRPRGVVAARVIRDRPPRKRRRA